MYKLLLIILFVSCINKVRAQIQAYNIDSMPKPLKESNNGIYNISIHLNDSIYVIRYTSLATSCIILDQNLSWGKYTKSGDTLILKDVHTKTLTKAYQISKKQIKLESGFVLINGKTFSAYDPEDYGEPSDIYIPENQIKYNCKKSSNTHKHIAGIYEVAYIKLKLKDINQFEMTLYDLSLLEGKYTCTNNYITLFDNYGSVIHGTVLDNNRLCFPAFPGTTHQTILNKVE